MVHGSRVCEKEKNLRFTICEAYKNSRSLQKDIYGFQSAGKELSYLAFAKSNITHSKL